jgi:hypothetical protein
VLGHVSAKAVCAEASKERKIAAIKSFFIIGQRVKS